MTTETPSSMRSDASRADDAENEPRGTETRSCATCGVRFLIRKSWQRHCSDQCRRKAHQGKPPLPVRLAITTAIRLLEREAVLRHTSIEGGWEEFEEHARVLREYVGAGPE